MDMRSSRLTAEERKRYRKILIRYLGISAFCVVFYLIYNKFSHEIHSPWMTFLFAWPLVLGALPAVLEFLGVLPGSVNVPPAAGEQRQVGSGNVPPAAEERQEDELGNVLPAAGEQQEIGGIQKDIYRFGIAALTSASLLKGVLEIAGTGSRYTDYLVAAGFAMLAAGAVGYFLAVLNDRKTTEA